MQSQSQSFNGTALIARTDIAVARILGLGVQLYGDPLVNAVWAYFQPTVMNGLTAMIGPKTTVGRTSVMAVATLHAVKRQLDRAEETGIREGTASCR